MGAKNKKPLTRRMLVVMAASLLRSDPSGEMAVDFLFRRLGEAGADEAFKEAEAIAYPITTRLKPRRTK